jgi:hypothetical protein
MQFRKKPVVIEAVQWDGNQISDVPMWISEALQKDPKDIGGLYRYGRDVHIFTLEGVMIAAPSDWIIRGVKGEIYPCKDEIFRMTYEPAAQPAAPTAPVIVGPSEAKILELAEQANLGYVHGNGFSGYLAHEQYVTKFAELLTAEIERIAGLVVPAEQ